MSDFLKRISDLPPKKLALLAAQLQQRLEKSEAKRREPIAIVAAGCKFPGGADNPEAFWKLLVEGRDAVREVPAGRWDADELYDPDYLAPGKMTTRWGGFVDGVDQFDARLFGISPREAISMDPQQRLLLETVWQALERAAVAPESLLGSRTGMFVGISTADYFQLQLHPGLKAIDAYLASGCAPSVAAGRISYTLGLQGPAVSVDTACSSSLVSIHMAVQALRNDECDAALAGGVNLVLSPVTTIALSKSQMMAPDGRCKAFDARADGFVRGEGCGMLYLKRLSDAQEAGDPIVALIRGSAINQDGRSNGLTAPNGPSQEAVIRAALANAGVKPHEVSYVEAHGTGTSLGDPIEAQALDAVLREDRPAGDRVHIASVKTNIGHLESAAGVAGVIKTLMCLQNEMLPPHQHLKKLSPMIPWDEMCLLIPTKVTPWEGVAGSRIAGVSSFGFSGTNGHVILEQAPPLPEPEESMDRGVYLATVSAQSPEALAASARLQQAALTEDESGAAALRTAVETCHTLNTGRNHFPHRAAVIAEDLASLKAGFSAIAEGESSATVQLGHVESLRAPQPVFLFTGQGAQVFGMAQELYEHEPVVKDCLDHCDQLLRAEFDLPLLDVMHGSDDGRIHQTQFTQPCLFSVSIALAKLWESWGVRPAAVMGHSVGEYAAAVVAGLLDLDSGLRLIATRGRLMQALPAGGKMAAVFADGPTVEAALTGKSSELSVAAYNGPTNVVISGAGPAVDAQIEAFAEQGIKARALEVSHAFHSPLMEPMLEEFGAYAAQLEFAAPRVPLYSNVTGQPGARETFATAEYWKRHVREPVRFAQTLQALYDSGQRLFVELGPQPTLIGMGARCIDGDEADWLPSIRKGRSERTQLAKALATLYTRGVDVDWDGWQGEQKPRRRVLPTYPLQRERFWLRDEIPTWSAGEGDGSAEHRADDLDKLLFRVEWPKVGTPALRRLDPSEFLAAPSTIADVVNAAAPELAKTHALDVYGEMFPEMERLGTVAILDAFRKLGWTLEAGATFTFAAIVEKTGIVRPHHRLLHRLLEILCEDGFLQQESGRYTVLRSAEPEDPAQLGESLAARWTQFDAEFTLLRRTLADLAPVLRGEADPLQVLFPGGSTEETERVYQDAPMAQTFNGLVKAAVEAAIAETPTGRTLKILEVGAGTGGTTASLLPILPPDQTEYTFTDISPAFLTKAKSKFKEFPFVRYATLDASAALEPQGFQANSFDLIIAANVIHATPRLRETLSGVHALLADSGLLVMLEATTKERFADLTVGYTDGWWSFEDTDLRSDYAILDRERWQQLLGECGFTQAQALPDAAPESPLGREAVVLARARKAADAPKESADWGSGTWLIVGNDQGAAGQLAGQITRDGGVARVLGPGMPAGEPGREAWTAAIRELPGSSIEGVVHVGALEYQSNFDGPRSEFESATHHLCESTLHVVQGLLQAEKLPKRGSWWVTEGAQHVTDGPGLDPVQATLWGMGHVIELEHPELGNRRLDLDPDMPRAAQLGQLAEELRDPDGREPQVALRGENRHARRMAYAELPKLEPVELRADASYLVSGGLRGLGLLVAQWMVERGARNLVLYGRSAPNAESQAKLDQLRGEGVKILVEQLDASDERAVSRLFSRIGAEMPPLAGVIHNAGALDDGVILQQSWERFAPVFAPKVWGTWSLWEHLKQLELDWCVLFSSGVGLVGSPGQINHAAANAFVDMFAHRLRAEGVRAVSVNWGAWSEIGAAADLKVTERRDSFTPQQGLAALDRILAQATQKDGHGQVAVRPEDWSDILDRYAAGSEPSFYRDIAPLLRAAESAEGETASQAQTQSSFAEQWAAIPKRKQAQFLKDEIRKHAASVLDLADPSRIELAQPLNEMGLDSLMSVELRNKLGQAFDMNLPATLLFEQPSVAALTKFLQKELATEASDETGSAEADLEPSGGEAQRAAPEEDGGELDSDAISDEDLAAALSDRLDKLEGN